jgi:hypothetical protein
MGTVLGFGHYVYFNMLELFISLIFPIVKVEKEAQNESRKHERRVFLLPKSPVAARTFGTLAFLEDPSGCDIQKLQDLAFSQCTNFLSMLCTCICSYGMFVYVRKNIS